MPTLRRDSFTVGFWAALGAATLLLLAFTGGRVITAALAVITPFVAAFVIALLLDPLVDKLQRHVGFLHRRRTPAVLLIYLLFLLSFVALLTFLVPNLVGQATDLAQQFPTYVQNVRKLANDWLVQHRTIGPVHLPANIETLSAEYSNQLDALLKTSAQRTVALIIGSVTGLLNVVLIPIITFYLLTDLPRLRGRVLFLMPERFRPFVMSAASDMGGVFGNYIRGMLIVSVAYGLVATVIFFLFDLRSYALLLGFAAGLLYAVPFVGPFVTALLAGVVSLATGHSIGSTGLLLAVVLAQNQAFDNFVVPRVVGDSVGLHPLLTLFALFMGGEMFGLWGMLLSVPVAASIQVVLFRRFPKLSAPTPIGLVSRTESEAENDTVTRDSHEAALATDEPAVDEPAAKER